MAAESDSETAATTRSRFSLCCTRVLRTSSTGLEERKLAAARPRSYSGRTLTGCSNGQLPNQPRAPLSLLHCALRREPRERSQPSGLMSSYLSAGPKTLVRSRLGQPFWVQFPSCKAAAPSLKTKREYSHMHSKPQCSRCAKVYKQLSIFCCLLVRSFQNLFLPADHSVKGKWSTQRRRRGLLSHDQSFRCAEAISALLIAWPLDTPTRSASLVKRLDTSAKLEKAHCCPL